MPAFPEVTSDALLKARRICCIQPHYDDNDLYAGGTLALLHDLGAELTYITVTDDLVGVLDQSLSDAQMQTQLRAEQFQAGRIIGVDHHDWLGYPDAGPYDYYRLRMDIIGFLRLLRPDFVFTVDPWLPYEAHRDHILTGLAVAEAAYLMNFSRIKTKEEIDRSYVPYKLQGVCFYLTSAPNLVIDISSTCERKHQAILQYQAQFTRAGMEKLIADTETREQIVGRGKHYGHAESFKAISPNQLHCNPEQSI
jgi:N,N'-diacetylchitobiose non-reducing end deacetylase